LSIQGCDVKGVLPLEPVIEVAHPSPIRGKGCGGDALPLPVIIDGDGWLVLSGGGDGGEGEAAESQR
jgi:hypothetical protein